MALPNNLLKWPEAALNRCTNLKKITAYGPEADTIEAQLIQAHFIDCLNLESVQIPSTIGIGIGAFLRYDDYKINLKSLILPKNLISIDETGIKNCYNLSFLDFSRCKKLEIIGGDAFWRGYKLRNLDLSNCLHLKPIGWHAFLDCISLATITFPSSEFKINVQRNGNPASENPSFSNTSIKTVIWKGRKERPTGFSLHQFHSGRSFNQLVASGQITEIFIP